MGYGGKKIKNMTKEKRAQHIAFIESDTKQRGETIIGDIVFFAAIYECKVKKDGDKRSKSIMYSAAETVMKGYREIKC